MSTVSTFSGFTMARLGIMASSKAMEVVGNNISNINTKGYTRQSLDQRALYMAGADVYASQFDVRVGAGALTTGVSQLRDPYLDIRFRNENAQVGFYEGKYEILRSLSLIMDEVGKGEEDGGIVEKQFNELLEQLQVMNTEHAGDVSYDSAVRKSAEGLVDLFHTYSSAIDRVMKDTTDEFTENLGKINNNLKKIRELNESIKKAEISSGALSETERKEGMIGERGQQALELRDQRNVIIDELSKLIPIDVKYSDESIGAGMTVEKLTITLKGNSDAVLVDGVYFGQLSVQETPVQNKEGQLVNTDGDPIEPKSYGVDKNGYLLNADGKWITDAGVVTTDIKTAAKAPDNLPTQTDPYLRLQISVLENNLGQKMASNKPGGKVYKIDDQEIKGGEIQAQREMLTKVGEYSSADEVGILDPNAATKRGIRYYQNTLDALAQKVAKIFNDANTLDKDGNDAIGKIDGAGILFSSVGDKDVAEGITAANIYISYSWAHQSVHIIQTRDPEKNHLSTANDNIVHLIAQMQADQEFRPSDLLEKPAGTGSNHNPRPGTEASNDDPFFTGTFQGMLTYVNNMLGNDQETTGNVLDNYYSSAEELDMSRESVSGVDLNDEAVSMMQLQKSYSASCRLLTTIDELLDKLINGTGVAGR